jgi:uncharacterized protein (TIGR00730 family)
MNICVYCSSSDYISPSYFETARALGRLMADRDHTLIYGGGNVGLMGALARSLHLHGGKVVGVIPAALRAIEGIAYAVAEELIITETMQERKRIMFTRADAFMVLPGGFGTLEELMEVLTLRKLKYHTKPIVLVNTAGFFDPLESLFEHFYREQFAQPHNRSLYRITQSPSEALDYTEAEH